MTTTTPEHPEEEGSPTANVAGVGPVLKSETYEIPSMVLSRKHWDRLKQQIKEAKIGWTDLWLGGAFAFFGVAASTLVARLTLPGPTQQSATATRLSSELQAILVFITVAAALLFVVCLLAWLNMRKEHNTGLDGVVRNMESHERGE